MKTKKPPNPNPHETPRFASLLDEWMDGCCPKRKEGKGKGTKETNHLQTACRPAMGLFKKCVSDAVSYLVE